MADTPEPSPASARMSPPEVRVRRIHRRVRGCTHLVLEVAENNDNALRFYRGRSFYKLDAAVFLAKKVVAEEELLPPRKLKRAPSRETLAVLRGESPPRAARARKKDPPSSSSKD